MCNSQEIEEEYHFVSICKEYIFRQTLYNKINEKSDIRETVKPILLNKISCQTNSKTKHYNYFY